MPEKGYIPDDPTLDEAKALCLELLPTCEIHKCLMVRNGCTSEQTGKSCFYTVCPQCRKSHTGTVTMEFTVGVVTVPDTIELNLIVDEKGIRIIDRE